MALKEIIKKIDTNFESKADEIINSAREKADEIKSENRIHLQKEIDSLEENNRRFEAQHKKQIISKVSIDASKKFLLAREHLVNQAFEKLEEELASLNKKERTTLIKACLKEASSIIDKGVIIPVKKDMVIIEEHLPKGFKLGEELEEHIGGFIVNDKSEKIVIDYTFEEILKRKKSAIRILMVKELFGE